MSVVIKTFRKPTSRTSRRTIPQSKIPLAGFPNNDVTQRAPTPPSDACRWSGRKRKSFDVRMGGRNSEVESTPPAPRKAGRRRFHVPADR